MIVNWCGVLLGVRERSRALVSDLREGVVKPNEAMKMVANYYIERSAGLKQMDGLHIFAKRCLRARYAHAGAGKEQNDARRVVLLPRIVHALSAQRE